MPQARISVTVRCLCVVTGSTTPLRPVDVARKLNVRCNVVRVLLTRLCDRGDIIQTPDGRYATQPTDEVQIWNVFGVR